MKYPFIIEFFYIENKIKKTISIKHISSEELDNVDVFERKIKEFTNSYNNVIIHDDYVYLEYKNNKMNAYMLTHSIKEIKCDIYDNGDFYKIEFPIKIRIKDIVNNKENIYVQNILIKNKNLIRIKERYEYEILIDDSLYEIEKEKIYLIYFKDIYLKYININKFTQFRKQFRKDRRINKDFGNIEKYVFTNIRLNEVKVSFKDVYTLKKFVVNKEINLNKISLNFFNKEDFYYSNKLKILRYTSLQKKRIIFNKNKPNFKIIE